MAGIRPFKAIRPKESINGLVLDAILTPIDNGKRNEAVKGPEAAPPESKAMAVNILGVIFVKIVANVYIIFIIA